jgi:pseudouridine-5'-phosphate glycosidase
MHCPTLVLAGMPYPQNLQTALEVEELVRQHGAVPATIAIIGGQPCIGRPNLRARSCT